MTCCRFSRWWPLLICALLSSWGWADQVWTESVTSAFRESSELGRPVLVLVTGAGCGPCQVLKQELHNLGTMGGAASHLVILELDVHGDSFRAFRQSHPDGFTGTIPMVYLFDAHGNQHYAQAGLIPRDQMQSLLQSALRSSGPPLDHHQVAQLRGTLAEVRTEARAGRLIAAWALLQVVTAEEGSAAVVKLGRKYERQLLEAMEELLTGLDQQLSDPAQAHAAAVRLAVIYVQARDVPSIQSRARAMLARYGHDPNTRDAVLQAKFLVRARVAEQRQQRDEAIVSYTQILKIDRESPIGLVAANRLPGIQAHSVGSTNP
jgi:thioredoxin-like negative regulator of GroEL